MVSTTVTGEGVHGRSPQPVAISPASLAGAAITHLHRAASYLWWYVREVLGANAYQHYLDRFAVEHANHPEAHEPLSEREFWKRHIDEMPLDARCC